jgi:hypothetical protein
VEATSDLKGKESTGIVNWHVALATFAVLLLVGGFVIFFRAKRNAEWAATRRAENEKLAHDAMIREENRRSAYAGRVVVPPAAPVKRLPSYGAAEDLLQKPASQFTFEDIATLEKLDKRLSTYAGRVLIRPPGSPIGVAVKKRKAKKP